MVIKNHVVLQHLEKLGKEDPAAKILAITHLDDPILYITSEEDILLMIQAADAFVKNDHKPAHLHANSFYRHAWALLD